MYVWKIRHIYIYIYIYCTEQTKRVTPSDPYGFLEMAGTRLYIQYMEKQKNIYVHIYDLFIATIAKIYIGRYNTRYEKIHSIYLQILDIVSVTKRV